MTWEIVVGIIALVGAAGTLCGYSFSLSKTLTNLKDTITALNETLKELKKDNKEAHKAFYDRIDNHERRITVIEDKIK